MSLTVRQKEAIMTSLNSKGINANCLRCGKNQWDLGNDLVATIPTQPGAGMAIGGQHVPMVQMICMNCGFVNFHAAGLLGVPINPPESQS